MSLIPASPIPEVLTVPDPSGMVVEVRPQSAIQYQLFGRLFPMVSEPRCKTCQCLYRQSIEQWLLQGMAAARIAKWMQENIPAHAISEKSIRTHWKRGHLPQAYFAAAAAETQQRRGPDALYNVDGEGILHAVEARGFDRLAKGEIDVEMTHLLAALRMDAQLEMFKAQLGANRDDSTKTLNIILDVISRRPDALEILTMMRQRFLEAGHQAAAITVGTIDPDDEEGDE